MSMWDVWLCAAMLVSMAWCGAFDSPELALLIVQESHASLPNQPVRRITPKSVFVAPSFTTCAEGYREDSMGRCVKVIKVSQAAQWDFILKKLNAMYGVPEPTRNKGIKGPVRVAIPLATEKPTPAPPPQTTQETTTEMSTTLPPSTVRSTVYEPTMTNSDFNPYYTNPDDRIGNLYNQNTGFTQPDYSDVYYPQGTTTNYYSNRQNFPSTVSYPEETTQTPFVIVVPNTTVPEHTSTELSTDESTTDSPAPPQPSTKETVVYSTSTYPTTFPTSTMTDPPRQPDSQQEESFNNEAPIPKLPGPLTKRKCAIPVQVSRLEDSRDTPGIDCEEEVAPAEQVEVKRPSVRFPTDTRKRPASYVRFPDVNRVWENRPYWWPQNWDRQQTYGRPWPSQGAPASYQKIQHYAPSWNSGNPVWSRGH